MTRFVLAVILAVTSTFVGGDVAVATSNYGNADGQASVTSTNVSEVDISEFRQTPAENSSRVNPRPVLQPDELAQVFVPMSWACYIPLWARAPAPVGSEGQYQANKKRKYPV